MEESSPRITVVGPVAALMLGGAALVLFGVGDAIGFLSETAEPVFLLTSILGWVLLAWSVILAAVSLTALVRRGLGDRAVSAFELALLGACLAVDVLAVSLRPLWGSGGGAGGPVG